MENKERTFDNIKVQTKNDNHPTSRTIYDRKIRAFVGLKAHNGEIIYVNPNRVCFIEKYGDNESLIWFNADTESSNIIVSGKPSSVAHILNQ